MESSLDKVSPDVVSAVRDRGEAHVMIALDDTADAAVAVRREWIAGVRADVLSMLGPEDYRDRQAFLSVAVLSGTVLSLRALRILDAHPRVRRVDLDPAGTGSRTP